MLFPVARLLLLRVNVPVAPIPDGLSTAEPSRLLPRTNVTLPVGIKAPPAAWTVTVSTVVDGLMPGVDDSAVVVMVGEAATVTSTEPDELARFPAET